MSDSVERRGEVIAVEDGVALVRLEAAAGCSGCGSRGSCASGSAAAQVIRMPLPARTRTGDRISVSLPASSVALAALLGYLLPPVGLLLGTIAAAISFAGDVAAVLGAGLGLLAGLLLARLLSRLAFASGFSPSVSGCAASVDSHPGELS